MYFVSVPYVFNFVVVALALLLVWSDLNNEHANIKDWTRSAYTFLLGYTLTCVALANLFAGNPGMGIIQ